MFERQDFSRKINIDSQDEIISFEVDVNDPCAFLDVRDRFNAESVVFREGVFEIKKNGKFFFFNPKNGMVSKKFDGINQFYRGQAKVQIGERWYVIDHNFNIIF